MQNNTEAEVTGPSCNITGSKVVTYIHTNARKIVFPMAIFLSRLNGLYWILGAEYEKVSPVGNKIQNQDWRK